MANGFQPHWLRLPEALDVLKSRCLTLADAKAAVTRAIQDRLIPRSPSGMFRLPEWRYSPRFPGRTWVTTPIIDWENSTIVAPHAIGTRRISADCPTLIEVSADVLDREFAGKQCDPAQAERPPETSNAAGALIPHETQTVYSTGTPGRPTSRHLILGEASQRIAEGRVPDTLSEFASDLEKWLKKAHSTAPQMTKKTIENCLRACYKAHKNKAPKL